MPETLYSLGKPNPRAGNYAAAEKAWKHVIELDKTGTLRRKRISAYPGYTGSRELKTPRVS